MIVLDIGLLVSVIVAIIAAYLFYQTLGVLRASKRYIEALQLILQERNQLIERLAYELEKHGGADDQLLIQEARQVLNLEVNSPTDEQGESRQRRADPI